MSNDSTFWIIVSILVVSLFFASLREAILLSKMPEKHPERGLYWFNVCFFLVASGVILVGGIYLDSSRSNLEQLIRPYPDSRYAHERNGLMHGNTWTYVSSASPEEIRIFYKEYAAQAKLQVVDDATDNERLAFLLPSGDLYLTLLVEDEKTILYFSKAGSMKVMSGESQDLGSSN